ncbi:glutathione S-transferase N-terminal domain-containing protein [Lyngbya aestuarii]|uniref:glutathione S-transferase N-terminal domain-containing protein n=1 Tax=Lyngbya aestuarii TaxID=118322 RepID=UPI00403D9B79
MMKFYYNRLSVNARRVWVTLLEKQLTFEPILVNLDGDQFQPEFTAINPLQRIPVLVDDGFTVVESLAILDYLEAKCPTPALLPQDAKSLATVRMVEMVTLNELLPATIPLMRQMMELAVDSQKLDQAKQQIAKVLNFFESKLGNSPYFINEQLTLADIVAGTAVPSLPLFGISLDNYPKLQNWCDALNKRESWQQTTPNPEEIEAAKSGIREILARRCD